MDLNKIRRLNLPKGKYCVFGSGPMEMAGLRKSKDVDIIVKKDLWEELSKNHEVIDNKKIKIDDIMLWRDWLPWISDINKVIDNSENIEGIYFAQLEDVKEWKLRMGRTKDIEDIKLIDNFLNFDKGN